MTYSGALLTLCTYCMTYSKALLILLLYDLLWGTINLVLSVTYSGAVVTVEHELTFWDDTLEFSSSTFNCENTSAWSNHTVTTLQCSSSAHMQAYLLFVLGLHCLIQFLAHAGPFLWGGLGSGAVGNMYTPTLIGHTCPTTHPPTDWAHKSPVSLVTSSCLRSSSRSNS